MKKEALELIDKWMTEEIALEWDFMEIASLMKTLVCQLTFDLRVPISIFSIAISKASKLSGHPHLTCVYLCI